MGQERELKLQLTQEEAGRLEHLLGPPADVILQLNYYLDTSDGLLRRQRHGLRLRKETHLSVDKAHGATAALRDSGAHGKTISRFVLTLKGPSRAAGEIVERAEAEAEISQAAAEHILEDGLDPDASDLEALKTLAARLGIRRLLSLGHAENERRLLPIRLEGQEKPAWLALDRTSFPDGSVDYEAEFELPTATEPPAETCHSEEIIRSTKDPLQALRDLFAAAGLPWKPRHTGKFARFLQRRGQP